MVRVRSLALSALEGIPGSSLNLKLPIRHFVKCVQSRLQTLSRCRFHLAMSESYVLRPQHLRHIMHLLRIDTDLRKIVRIDAGLRLACGKSMTNLYDVLTLVELM